MKTFVCVVVSSGLRNYRADYTEHFVNFVSMVLRKVFIKNAYQNLNLRFNFLLIRYRCEFCLFSPRSAPQTDRYEKIVFISYFLLEILSLQEVYRFININNTLFTGKRSPIDGQKLV